MSMAEVIESVGLRRFTVEEYHLMAETGVFAPEERVELIRGVIRQMTPKGRRHAIAVAKAIQVFAVQLSGRATVFVQDPLLKNGFHSQPEPDVLITSNPDPESYGTEQSSPLLVIEVADSSLKYDRDTKAALYADAEIPEYWVVNLVDDVLELFIHPQAGAYQSRTTYQPGHRISPRAWPDVEIDVAELIPAPTE
jgi:Uma2 family endonuclease